jgi:hypothetical protein
MEELRTVSRPVVETPVPQAQVVNGTPSYNNVDDREVPAFLRKRRRG